MKNKKFYNNADRAILRSNTEKVILENFSKTFNKIKRIDENEVGNPLDNIIGTEIEVKQMEGVEGRFPIKITGAGEVGTVTIGGFDEPYYNFPIELMGNRGELHIHGDGSFGIRIGGESRDVGFPEDSPFWNSIRKPVQNALKNTQTNENDGPTHDAPWNEPQEPEESNFKDDYFENPDDLSDEYAQLKLINTPSGKIIQLYMLDTATDTFDLSDRNWEFVKSDTKRTSGDEIFRVTDPRNMKEINVIVFMDREDSHQSEYGNHEY